MVLKTSFTSNKKEELYMYSFENLIFSGKSIYFAVPCRVDVFFKDHLFLSKNN
jgi:hypothetical protein